jgi:hypothetical protein
MAKRVAAAREVIPAFGGNVLEVEVDGLGRKVEVGSRLLDGASQSDAAQHVDLALGHVGGPPLPNPRPRISRSAEYSGDGRGIEPAVAGH